MVTTCSPLGLFFSAGWYPASACRMLATRLRCSSTAPLLTPVVPPVYCSTAMSSGPTLAGLNVGRRPMAGAWVKRTAPGGANLDRRHHLLPVAHDVVDQRALEHAEHVAHRRQDDVLRGHFPQDLL